MKWAFLAAFLLVSPLAAASGGAFEIHTARDVRLEGPFAVYGNGPVFVEDDRRDAPATLRGATGTITIIDRVETSAESPLSRTPVPPEPTDRIYHVENATLSFDLVSERFHLRARPGEDGQARVDGSVVAEGTNRVLTYPLSDKVPGTGPDVLVPGGPDPVWACETGWGFVGRWGAEVGGIAPQGAHVSLVGAFDLDAFGGNVSFVDASGALQKERLGAWLEETVADARAVRVEREHFVRLFFDGVLASASIPVGSSWGLCAPGLAWDVQGTAVWSEASGYAETGGVRRDFDDATLVATGLFTTQPEGSGSTSVRPVRYAGSGEFSAITVDGERLEPVGVSSSKVVPVFAVIAIVAIGFLYSRIGPADALVHPVRREILTAVKSRPGIHKRELHRLVGGGWGAFSFHVRVLLRTGHLRAEGEGGYRTYFARGSDPNAPGIPSALARRIYDELPGDGTVVHLADLKQRLGISRQLLSYHLERLEGSGYVRVVRATPLRKGVVRARV